MLVGPGQLPDVSSVTDLRLPLSSPDMLWTVGGGGAPREPERVCPQHALPGVRGVVTSRRFPHQTIATNRDCRCCQTACWECLEDALLGSAHTGSDVDAQRWKIIVINREQMWAQPIIQQADLLDMSSSSSEPATAVGLATAVGVVPIDAQGAE